ncbi:hypothetical protein [Nocardiopsis sp. B62]|uniref:hypothetical protein n=1 Tax=Nocardiopsis sp. B62 TaxID=2824874 RepID=UPI001B3994C4|nr:hypothetical protein [Nocardiopsis sp. B62]MBQ1081304.1 hypothetical protein [Nocardiopsis sp. B62]
MPLHRTFHKTEPQKLLPGDWRSLRFDVDERGERGRFYSLVGQGEPRGALYDLSVGVVLEGVDPGAEVQLRASEYVRTGDEWVVARDRPIDSPAHVGGRAHFTYSWKDLLEPGRRVRVRVAQFGRSPAVIVSAEATALFWPGDESDPGHEPLHPHHSEPHHPQPHHPQPYYGQPGHHTPGGYGPPPHAAYPPPQAAPGAYPPPPPVAGGHTRAYPPEGPPQGQDHWRSE